MGTDAFTGRATDMAPQVILLYLKLPQTRRTSTSQENVDGCTYPGFDH